MIFADLHEAKRLWKSETRTNSLTSGPRSPTKIEYSGPRSSRLIYHEFSHHKSLAREQVQTVYIPSIGEPSTGGPVQLKRSASVGNHLAIQAECLGRGFRGGKIDEAISGITSKGVGLAVRSRKKKRDVYPENLSRIILTLTCSPIPNQTLRMKFSSIQGSNSPILH